MSDRLFGLAVILAGIAYIVSATSIQTGFMVDPMGPKAFPILVGGVAVLCAALIIIKPDEQPSWPEGAIWLRLLLAVITLVAYAFTLKDQGFLIPTAIAAGVLSYQIQARPLPAFLTGLGLSIGLYVLFKHLLGLSLVALPKAMMS